MSNPLALTFTMPPRDPEESDALITETREGLLHCDDHDMFWCDHIERAIKDNLDADTLWQRRDEVIEVNGEDTVQIIVQIPMMPTKNIWAGVSLVPCGIPATRKLQLIEAKLWKTEFPSLGFVHPGEGRGTIRSQMIDWFYSVVDTSRLECSDTSHGFPAQMDWEAHVQHGNSLQFPEFWTVFTTGRCLACNTSDFDFGDLVPESERNTWASTVGKDGVKF